MLKKTITYETFDGETVTEDFHFHLSKADLVELEMSKKGGLEAWLKRVVESRDGRAIMEEFKNLIMMAVGEKSEDGRHFRKSVEVRHNFKDSPAYDVLFMELVTNPEKAAEFVNGIIPRNLEQTLANVPKPARSVHEAAGAAQAQAGGNVFDMHRDSTEPSSDLVGHPTGRPDGIAKTEPKVLTRKEAVELDGDELQSGLMTGRYVIGKD